MADITLADLRSALQAEGVQVDEDALSRAFRKMSNPNGCSNCGMHVKMGTVRHGESGHGIYTTCCGNFEQAVDEPEKLTVRGRKRNG